MFGTEEVVDVEERVGQTRTRSASLLFPDSHASHSSTASNALGRASQIYARPQRYATTPPRPERRVNKWSSTSETSSHFDSLPLLVVSMDTLPIYYKRESTASTTNDSLDPPPSRLSFPVSVRSFDSRQSTVPPVPPRPEQWQNLEQRDEAEVDNGMRRESTRTSRASKRGSVMLLNGPNGLMSGKGGNQQDWMRQFKPLSEEEEDPEETDRTLPSSLFPNSTLDHSQLPMRSSSRSPVLIQEPPSLPPRPPKHSTPSPLSSTSSDPSLSSSPSSSCPPTMSPFATMSSSTSKPLMAPPPLPARSKSPRFTRPSTASATSTSSSTSSTLPNSSSSSSLNFGGSSITAAFNRGLKQTGLRDKFVAGVGFTKEWGGKGKGKLQEFTNNNSSNQSRTSTSSERTGGGGLTSSASSPQFETFPSSATSPTAIGSPSTNSNTIRLPAVIFDIPVPRITGIAFGVPLTPLVAQTHLASSLPPRPQSLSPITGDSCLLYLPSIAYRCLEYLSEWGLKEEGIYRIPGSALAVAQLRALFDAGLGAGSECDLREVHPSRLDPNAVASLFKNWLRELPESLLSTKLESKMDQLTLDHLGYTASSSHFLSSTAPTSNSTTTSPNPDHSTPGTPKRVAPIKYLEELAELFAEEMPAENFYLLRAISYHLSLLASHSSTNKMTLTNLRLILSPTLRLSPGFLLVLVEEREIIFGGVNRDAKTRQAATSHLVTPPLLSIPTFSSSTPSPSSRSPTPQITSSTSSSMYPERPHRDQTTPIAEKFSLHNTSAIPLAPSIPSTATATSNMAPNPPTVASLPSQQQKIVPTRRTDQTEGFFSSRLNHEDLRNPPTSTNLRDPSRKNERPETLNLEEEQKEEAVEQIEEEEEEERKWRERERIKSADLKLALPEGFEDSLGLGLGFGGMSLSDHEKRESRVERR